jgi:ferredoxin
MLLDLAETIPAALTVVDAIVGQEGPGPGAGVPRRFGLLAAGTSALAVDVACAQALGLDPREVATLAEAARRRAPFATAAEVELLGERLRDVAVADLARPRASATMMLPKAVLRLGKRALTARPSVHAASCRGCGDCARICGAEAITMIDRAPRFDDERCIRCLCCHEICPAAAIDLRAGPLARLLGEPAVRTSR